MEEQSPVEEEWPSQAYGTPGTMERHYRALVLAILFVTAAGVCWIGWDARRDRPSSPAVMAAPRQATVPLTGTGSEAVTRSADATASSTPAPSPSGSRPAGAGDGAAPRVHVVGAVRRSGVYLLSPRARVVDAVRQAGGARPDADLEAINLADFVRDGEQIRVPSRRETARAATRPPIALAAAASSSPPSPIVRLSPRRVASASPPTRALGRYPTAPTAAPGSPASAGGLVNINTAGPEELDTLPGVGSVTAQRILDYRREHGPFQRPEDLLQVSGIGEKKLAAMLDRVTVR